MNDDFHMTCEEIRQKYAEGVGIHPLADLNACHQSIIYRILAGEDYVWTEKNRSQGEREYKFLVVNCTDNKVYTSIRKAERENGLKQSYLNHAFKKSDRITAKGGKKFHLYRIPIERCGE